MKGKGIMTLTVGGRTVRHPVWVAAVQDPCILGLDFLRSTGCQLDLNGGTLSFQGGPAVTMAPPNITYTQPNKPFTPTVKAAETHGCPPSPTSVCDFSPVPLSPTAVCYIPPATPTTQPSVSPGRTPPVQLPQMGEERTLSAVREIWGRNCVGLDPEQQERLWQLLFEFRDSFALSEGEVGQTHLVQHEIDTGDARPIKMRPRRIPLARQEAADKAVLEMQRADFIEPSDSPWAAPVVMVPKKGGKLRFCADYRRLNEVTRKDSYPIPRIDESLDLVRGSSWLSSLDLRSGYWQVPLSPEARAKTAFSTNRGHWQFKVLCFGLCNAPATFERLMDRVLDGIPRQQCLVYLDDILAHGSSFQSALVALRSVLERVAAAGLKLHPEKCHFMRREVSFLGHRVGKEGISTMEDKVGAVRDWPTPTDQRQLKSFLGLASYYRRFVRGFSSVAAPLNRLLPKDKAFTWTGECEEAFNTLKCALIEAPVLAPPDLTLPFILDTDASNVGMGGVLAQVGPEGERVVAYFSRTFNKHERRYCVTRRELLAVVASIKHFKYYLGGLPFTVRTDHSALQWLMSFREPEGQMARWLEELQPYDFTVVHRAGARHSNADAMSRRPCTADGCRHCEQREGRERALSAEEGVCATVCRVSGPVCCELQTVDVAEWGQQQGRDTDLQPVLQWVEAQVRPPWEEVTALSLATKGLWSKFERLRLADGVLQRAWKESATGEERWQVVVPKALREAVLQ
uniref:Reverse transcriptase domain-containing protein n=1 Tax=Salmo trutta TaxID=8032 RepID=A0A673WIT2_SALTR